MRKLEKEDNRFYFEQLDCCNHFSTNIFHCSEEQLVVVSEGVLDGNLEVEGVRYHSPDHMSGWWLTTDLYDGNLKSLKTIHVRHVYDARPDLAIYMGLPNGYRFMLGGESEHVWFDDMCVD